MNKTVGEIIMELNSLKSGQEWIAVDGVHALTTVTNKKTGQINFNPASGIIVKSFLNTTTGEIKLFPAKIFGFPNKTDI